MVKLHPEHAAQLAGTRKCGLAPIRGEVNHLFERLTQRPKWKLSRHLRLPRRWFPCVDLASVSVIATGERFLESGTLLNYVRAVELGAIGAGFVSWLTSGTTRLTYAVALAVSHAANDMAARAVAGPAGGLVPDRVNRGIISLLGTRAGSGPVEVWAVGFSGAGWFSVRRHGTKHPVAIITTSRIAAGAAVVLFADVSKIPCGSGQSARHGEVLRKGFGEDLRIVDRSIGMQASSRPSG